jgi:aspartokinase
MRRHRWHFPRLLGILRRAAVWGGSLFSGGGRVEQSRGDFADGGVGKLSIVGVGMRSHSGVAAKMFETLAKNEINIDMISTSDIKISVVIALDKGEPAMRAIHAAFLG